MKKNEMRCPECGRVVQTDDIICPECGNYIDDTEIAELDDLDQEYSDSFEEEYQRGFDEEPEEAADNEVRTFRNLHTDEEMQKLDTILENLRDACRDLEQKHNELKHLYRQRKKLEGNPMQSFAGTIYVKHCKKARGIHWLRNIMNELNRGIPVDWLADWDANYFKRVLGWLGIAEEDKDEILQAVEAW